MAEVRCGDCGRPVFDGANLDEMGWIARCGRRVSRLASCGGNICEYVGNLKFEVDGALLSQTADDRETEAQLVAGLDALTKPTV